jgi:4-hydroxy-tetrahydrodipicolinate synthase
VADRRGSHGLVPVGTTGESATLDADEQARVIAACVDQAKGRVPGHRRMRLQQHRRRQKHMKAAEEAGAMRPSSCFPYYNRPNQEGIYAHFAALAEASSLPIVVYNVPGRTSPTSCPRRSAASRKLPNVVGDQGCERRPHPRHRPPEPVRRGFRAALRQMTTWRSASSHGRSRHDLGTRQMSRPRLFAQFHEAMAPGDRDTALALQERLFPLHKALFSDASPGPTKYALSRIRPGFPTELRLPMTPPSEASRRSVDEALEHAGLV